MVSLGVNRMLLNQGGYVAMRAFDIDLSPLFRSTVGFDRFGHLIESALKGDETAAAYPPYNIEKLGDDSYRIVMAVAGFTEDDLEVVVKEDVLLVSGKGREADQTVRFLHRGIAGRAFERRFELADHIQVAGARVENGLLIVDLVREIPEALKPRQIPIQSGSGHSDSDTEKIDRKAA